MTGLDTTVLVQLTDADNPAHSRAAKLLQMEMDAGRNLLLAPQVIAEFLHSITDERRFQTPLSMLDALNWVDDFLQNPRIQLVLPNQQSVRQANDWMRQFGLGRKRILDTQLAATLHAAGCRRLVTSNADDFKVFNVFELIVP